MLDGPLVSHFIDIPNSAQSRAKINKGPEQPVNSPVRGNKNPLNKHWQSFSNMESFILGLENKAGCRLGNITHGHVI